MAEKHITVRELLRNYNRFVGSQDTIIITRHGKPDKVLIPFSKWNKTKEQRKFTIAELKKYSLPGGPPDLSERIDEIAYPYPNPTNDDND